MKKLFTFLILSILGLPIAPSFAQTQVGENILGEAPLDRLGSSVALSSDGARVAVGAPGNDANGDKAGHVRVYEWMNGAWIQMGADIDGEAMNDNSGFSVSLSSDGNRVAIGAPGNIANGTLAGQTRVYEWMNGAWIQLGEDIDGKGADEQLGVSVSLSDDGNRVAIGAPFTYDAGDGHPAGKVQVYEWLSGAWIQLGTDIDGGVLEDEFGGSVSLSSDGNRVAIGAPFPIFPAEAGHPAGYVRVYEWLNGSWTQLGADIDGEASDDKYGWSVSLSSDGNRIAIGAPYNDGNGNLAGQVQVYEWENESWIQLGADIDGETAENYLGWSVSLSFDGNRVAMGAPGNAGNGPNAGQVRVYEWLNGSWTQLGANIDGEAVSDESGKAVSLSTDGNRVAVGASFNDENGSLAGQVRVFEFVPVSEVNPVRDIQLGIYPNPTTGQIFFTGLKPEIVRVIDGIGRLVFLKEMVVQQIDLSHLPNGIYFLQVSLDSQWISKMIIKE